MKKTLILMAVLGFLTATAQAEEVWTQGMDAATAAEKYTFTKYAYRYENPISGDEYMCFAISACNTLAWWQDQVEQNGAVIIPKEAPRGIQIWDQVRTEWQNLYNGGQTNRVMQYYLTGCTGYSNDSQVLTQKGLDFVKTGGYYPHLVGARYDMNTTVFPDECVLRYVDGNGWNSSKEPKEYEDGFTSYEGVSKYLVQLLKEGYGGVLKTSEHVMSFYAVETDDSTGSIIKIWYDDNNIDNHTLSTASVYAGEPNKSTGNNTIGANVKYGNNIRSFSLMRTRGLQFDKYDLTMTGGSSDEELYTHYLNLAVDGHQDYQLMYDLRNALDKDSPVNALIDLAA